MIIIDLNKDKNELYLKGNIEEIKENKSFRISLQSFNCSIKDDYIAIQTDNLVENLNKLIRLFKKHNIDTKIAQNSATELRNFEIEEKEFQEFSKKALEIKENHCNAEEFEHFITILNKKLVRTLYPLQLLSAYHLSFSQNACNFSVPGAGKTSIVYGAYTYLSNLDKNNSKYVNKLLIIGPLSSFGPWELEYKECFNTTPNIQKLVNMDKAEKKIHLEPSLFSPEIILISYASVISLQKDIIQFLLNNQVMVVLDEAHKIKNTDKGKSAKCVLELSKYAKSRVVLTGTPAPNSYEDLYNIFEFIWPQKNILGFNLNALENMSKKVNDKRVSKLIDNISPYFIRISKKDLGITAPIIHPPIIVEMNDIQSRIYEYIEKHYLDDLSKNYNSDTSQKIGKASALAKIIRLMQASSNPAMLKEPLSKSYCLDDDLGDKLGNIDDTNIIGQILDYENKETPSKFQALGNLVRQILDKKEKVIIWATFISTIESIEKYLENLGIKSKKLYGAVPVENKTADEDENDIETREKIIREFHLENSDFKVIIANPFAVAESISLHKACHNAIYLERSFNAAHFIQSKDRIHRFGLAKDIETNYYFILSKNTIDETIHSRLEEKEMRLNEILDSREIPLFNSAYAELCDNNDINRLLQDYVKRTKRA